MKKLISLLLVLLLMVTIATGCSRDKITNAPSGEAASDTEANSQSKGKSRKKYNEDTTLFGIPQETENYSIDDLSDPENEYIVENKASKIIGLEGYTTVSMKDEQGRNVAGSSFFIWARYGKAVVLKSIDYIGEDYHITLEEVEKGTPYSHEMMNIVVRNPFRKQYIKYTDGTNSRNLDIMDAEVWLERMQGEFQAVDLENNTIDLIPPAATIICTYKLVDVSPELLQGLKKGDKIDYMYGNNTGSVYFVKKAE